MGTAKPDPRLVGFVLAGGAATVINYGIYLGLLFVQVGILHAAALGYLSGVGISFVLNRKFVYASDDSIGGELFRYFVAYIAAMGLQLGVLQLLVVCGMNPIWANGIAVGVVVLANFFVVRRFVFR